MKQSCFVLFGKMEEQLGLLVSRGLIVEVGKEVLREGRGGGSAEPQHIL